MRDHRALVTNSISNIRKHVWKRESKGDFTGALLGNYQLRVSKKYQGLEDVLNGVCVCVCGWVGVKEPYSPPIHHSLSDTPSLVERSPPTRSSWGNPSAKSVSPRKQPLSCLPLSPSRCASHDFSDETAVLQWLQLVQQFNCYSCIVGTAVQFWISTQNILTKLSAKTFMFTLLQCLGWSFGIHTEKNL